MKVSGKRIYFRTFVLTKDHILILSNTMNKYRIIFSCFIALLLLPAMAHAADGERRIVVVTLDGYRWQELFGGADSAIINNKSFGDVADMKAAWWKASREERRETLMPFTWNYIAKNGVVIGNRWKGCKMDVTNHMWFSYPGYSENFCGYADDVHVNSNDPVENPNVSVFEVASQLPEFKDKVLLFGSWARFIEIFNEKRSRLEVNANYRHSMSPNPTRREKFIDSLEDAAPHFWGEERFDFLTEQYALEAMKSRHPKVIFIGLGDTDEWAHEGNYRLYLEAAHTSDAYLNELWEYTQNDPYYKGKTTFIVTCDHGRGDVKPSDWRDHGHDTQHSSQTWLMAFGAGIPAKGVLTSGEYHNNQVAPTIAELLGFTFQPKHEGVGKPIKF